MPLPTWRERFRQALRDQSLPSAKINRLVEEISSHIDDLITENPGMDAQALVESRLGSPERVAQFAKKQLWSLRRDAGRPGYAAQYRLSGLCRRQ
jgi:hypothetical protein